MGRTEAGFLAKAVASGHELEPGRSLPWLSNSGHLNPLLRNHVPSSTLGALGAIHSALGGDERALANKGAGRAPRPDFIAQKRKLLIEVDEIQHFTSDRLRTLDLYPAGAEVAYDVESYCALIGRWHQSADRYRAAKPTIDFPFPGGRRAQRAYFDAVRDLLAPYFGFCVLRVPAPECDPSVAFRRFVGLDR